MIIAPSLLAANFLNLENDIKKVENSSAEWLHLDIMDGVFVDNITFGYELVSSIRKITSLYLDCHLMISTPLKYVEKFCDAGANSITVHVENVTLEEFTTIKDICAKFNVKIGIAINPTTNIDNVFSYLRYTDMLLIMSVTPGFGGQKFVENTYSRLEFFKNKLSECNVKIQIDGGVNSSNGNALHERGADILVSGSYLFNGNFSKNVENMRNIDA